MNYRPIFCRRSAYGTSARPWVDGIVLITIVTVFSGCSKSGNDNLNTGPPEVLVTEVVQKDVPVVREWIGSLDGSVDADVRARVSGYLISQNYKEGTVVNKGDLLFQVDPSVYEAAVEQAKASLAQAEANQLQTEQTEQRETQLFQQKVESQQNLDNAVQSNTAAKAQVKAQQAALRQAELNLEFTKITAPIGGVAGIANPGIGDLVGPSDSNPLATISTVDPIRVFFQISEQDYLKVAQERIEANRNSPAPPPPIEIILADGTLYPRQGKFSAVDRQVDNQTGTIRLAALFPNPDNILRPGQFVRVRVTVKTLPGALLVPQRAVNELQTSFELAVVRADNKAEIRTVTVGDRVGSLWVVEDGLKPGERVVVEGLQKVRDNELVKPTDWNQGRPAQSQ
ncbi:MAG: efflux RND transporter periplasmic adaptor subunit [Verrucomicrobia bacterium]|nr:efflux RND transporter periplasmic adaptor subunit [Verrucomicrobiota bacterium]MBV8273674.1 efflux RND transporter periplasmic adaptor subunit [Verrucomicrobiota bacterium]